MSKVNIIPLEWFHKRATSLSSSPRSYFSLTSIASLIFNLRYPALNIYRMKSYFLIKLSCRVGEEVKHFKVPFISVTIFNMCIL